MKLLFILAISVVILSFQFLVTNINILQTPGYDYSFFYRTGQRILNKENPYAAIDNQPLRYPPTALLIFSTFALFPLIPSQFIFFFLSLFFFILGSIILFKSIVKLDHNFFKKVAYIKTVLIYTVLVLLFFPFRYLLSSLHIHSIIFLLFTLTIYYLVTKKDYLASVILALAGSLTITPFFILAIFFIQKRFKIITFTTINVLLISLVTMLILGQDIFLKFLSTTTGSQDFGIIAYYNQSITSLLSKIVPNQLVIKYLIILIIISILISLGFLKQRIKLKNLDIDLIFWNIGLLILLIFAPFTWQYHYSLAIISLVYLFYFWKKYNFSKKYLLLILVSYFLIGFNFKIPQEVNFYGLEIIMLSHVFFGGLLLFFLNFFVLKKLISRS